MESKEQIEKIKEVKTRWNTLTLNTGAKMPLEGFGVFQIPDAQQCETGRLRCHQDRVSSAGYRGGIHGTKKHLGKGVARAIADGV